MTTELKSVVEALLMASQEPLSLQAIQAAFDAWQAPTPEALEAAIHALQTDYVNRGIELVQVASGYRLQTRVEFSPWIHRLLEEKPAKYSAATLETLAIIAYKQPVTRGDIEAIRGVAVSTNVMRTLLDREWIKVSGYRNVLGKPALYVTTKAFLDYFNLQNINQLPDY